MLEVNILIRNPIQFKPYLFQFICYHLLQFYSLPFITLNFLNGDNGSLLPFSKWGNVYMALMAGTEGVTYPLPPPPKSVSQEQQHSVLRVNKVLVLCKLWTVKSFWQHIFLLHVKWFFWWIWRFVVVRTCYKPKQCSVLTFSLNQSLGKNKV